MTAEQSTDAIIGQIEAEIEDSEKRDKALTDHLGAIDTAKRAVITLATAFIIGAVTFVALGRTSWVSAAIGIVCTLAGGMATARSLHKKREVAIDSHLRETEEANARIRKKREG